MTILQTRTNFGRTGSQWNIKATTSFIDDLLTPRELEVVRLTVQGFSNKEIARTLDISHHTVSTHIRQIFSKLGVNRRVQLASFFADLADEGVDVGRRRLR